MREDAGVDRERDSEATAVFELSAVADLRRRSAGATELSPPLTEGWSRDAPDPERLLAVFDALWLRDGYRLRAYQYVAGGNGNAVVYALPADAPIREPDECGSGSVSPVPGVVLATPRPPEALDDLMEAIEGDRSPWSYLCASLFAREAQELGALWHGRSWSDTAVLGADPWGENPNATPPQTDYDRPGTPRSEWQWTAAEPEEWRPQVRLGEDGIEVSFVTFAAIGRESLWRHVDRYRPTGYTFTEAGYELGVGGGGFIY